ncbi:hypothetical protein BCR42DRAFT_460436 [Absidia repens]|uniref:SET domain-containing protein n=1 Tax=Absidia repens TaxID=90262 RepID=A0A1X2IK46_9FUNG|nr:hypothetical protein BCR42DRAFT_460436 [Absidia repens]
MDTTFEKAGSDFWSWLIDNKATISNAITFKDYRNENAGRGVVATQDIKEGEELFTIPRSLLFSTKTAQLAKKEDMEDVLAELDGWSPLILCMMYELDREDSLWKPYFDLLPRTFSTPMFWTDLKPLEGTDVMNKIGKQEADQCYDDQIVPILKAHPALFDLKVHNKELFHVCGSLIMAYSFHDEYKDESAAETSSKKQDNDDSDSEDEEEEEDQGLLAMVPMADMLNHKTGYNNARLFHEPHGLVMKSIKPITKGMQVYNTYGDLCNADLLRKYGFTDENNPHDLCEIDGEDVMNLTCSDDTDDELKEEKIAFLMDEGVMDDYFVIDADHEIPPEMVVAVIVFGSPRDAFKKMVAKEKLPSPKMTEKVEQALQTILKHRLSKYGTSLKVSLSL